MTTDNFVWRTGNNQCIPPVAMETKHIFYTLRMIWNHHMPEDAKIRPYKVYAHLGKTYTKEYLQCAIERLSAELATRSDLYPGLQDQLDQMTEYLRKQQEKIA